MSRRGFTLLEMLIMVIVAAILAAVAMPQYGRVVERGYWRSAQDILLTIYAGEQVAKTASANNKFVTPQPCAVGAPWSCIYMDDPTTAQVDYSVALVGGGTGFTATAKRTAAAGNLCNNDTLTITETKVTGGTWTSPCT